MPGQDSAGSSDTESRFADQEKPGWYYPVLAVVNAAIPLSLMFPKSALAAIFSVGLLGNALLISTDIDKDGFHMRYRSGGLWPPILLVAAFTVAAIISSQQWAYVAAAVANVGVILGGGIFYQKRARSVN